MRMLLLAITGSGTTGIIRLKPVGSPKIFVLGIEGGLECQSGRRRYTSIYLHFYFCRAFALCYTSSSFVKTIISLLNCMVPLVYSAFVWSGVKFCLMVLIDVFELQAARFPSVEVICCHCDF